jgi:hypothetical protein
MTYLGSTKQQINLLVSIQNPHTSKVCISVNDGETKQQKSAAPQN